MPVDLWGASGTYAVIMPNRLLGSLLLLLYVAGFTALLYIYRTQFRPLTSRQGAWAAILSLAAFITAQFASLPLASNPAGQPVAYLTVLAWIPILLAATFLPVSAVLVIGAAAGLAQAWGETHQWFTLFHYAFTAVGAAILMQQVYRGRVYRWLRQPVVVGLLGGLVLAVLAGVTVFAAGPWAGVVALDQALVVAGASLWPRLAEGLVAGVAATLVWHWMPEIAPKRPLVPSPMQRSLQNRLTMSYLGFTAVFILLTLVVLSLVAVTVSTRIVVDGIAQNAEMVAGELAQVPQPGQIEGLGLAKRANQWMRIVSEDGAVIAYFPAHENDSSPGLDFWQPEEEGLRPLPFFQTGAAQVYRGWDADVPFARELVVVVPGQGEAGWVVTAAPYTDVLQQAWGIGWPLLLVMLTAVALFYGNVLVLGRNITVPINEMVEASKTMAEGGTWSPNQLQAREDEIGKLQSAFAHMQRAMRKRLNELSLLLGVSQDVAATIDIEQGLGAILRGALRGTGAVGARAVVPNPAGGNPLTFGEGPSAAKMARLDRVIMTKLRHTPELVLSTPADVCQQLELEADFELPTPALMAISLHSHDRFQGILWLGFRQAHTFDETERNLLSTLSTQAAVLVENARLFSTAESGRRRLAAVLASTSDAVIVTDQTDRLLLINRAAEEIFELEANQVRNRPITDVIKVETLANALTERDERPQSLEIKTGEGRTYNAIASTIFSNEGQVFGRVAVLRDITYLKEIDEMKTDFVATVSHDLRSPLTSLRGYTTMIPMAGDLNEKQREYIDRIIGNIEQMTQMVEALQELIQIGHVDLRYEEIGVRPLLLDVASDYWQHAHLAGIKIEVDIKEDVTSLTGDLGLVRRALSNLVGNGIKYAPNSGMMVLSAQQLNGEVILSVKDNGPGISKEDQIRLFEKFYRVKERGTERVKGSGLGLAIVKTIAEKHGGRAWVQSQRGKGSTFFISFPLVETEATLAHSQVVARPL